MSVEEEMLKEISGFIHGYLKAGKLRINSFLTKINTNLSNLEQLLKVRFLLKEETKHFVRNLPNLLQHFKTTTNLNKQLNRGEVRGAIDWAETIKERLKFNHKDWTLFSTSESLRTYQTDENLVLKELLEVLYKLLYQDEYVKTFEQREWFSDWQKIKGNVEQVLKNVYLQRVGQSKVQQRMIEKTTNHRNPLYRNAAHLLAEYRKLMNGQYTNEDLINILRETFIAPKNKDVLFELYWIIQIIKHNTKESMLGILDGTQNLVAQWETDDYYYKIFHDSTGSVIFNINAHEISNSTNSYLKQKYASIQAFTNLAERYFGQRKKEQLWQGRPDFLLEVYDKNDNLVKLIIGEVKNTVNLDYAITGLRELIDYIHFVKDRSGDYLFGTEVRVQGILCLGDISFNTNTDMDLVKIVNREKKEGVVLI